MSLFFRRASQPAESPRTDRNGGLRARRFVAGAVAACLSGVVPVLGLAAPAHAAADTTAPSWGEVSLSPMTIDTSAGSATVTVTARITDDQTGITPSGGTTYGGSGYLGFRTSSGSQSLGASFSAASRISGTGLDGVYRTTIAVPRYAASGTWSINNASLSDSAGNSRYLYGAADAAAAGLTARFTQTGAGDTTAPTLAGVTFTPASVDTSAAARSVKVRLHVTDDLAGLDQTNVGANGGSAQIFLQGPAGTSSLYAYATAYNRVSGTPQDGVYDATVTLPRYSAPGTWSISGAYVADSAGNSRTLSFASDVAAAGITATFEQTGPGDTTPPRVSQVTVSPTQVNTAVSGQGVTVRARITDDLAGIITSTPMSTGGGATVSFSGSGTGAYTSATFTAANRVSGTETDGMYETTMVIPRATTGTFSVTGASATDAAGNTGPVTGDLGSPTVSVVGTVSAPSAPTAVSATAGNGSLTVNWTAPARDGGSALTGYRITADSPQPGGVLGCDPDHMPVTSQSGQSCDVTVSAGPSATSVTIPGLVNGVPYTVTVTATNGVGPGTPSAPTPGVKPYDPASDSTPPTLASLELAPASADTSAGAATVSVTARIVDDLSGISRPWSSTGVTLRSPSGKTVNGSFGDSTRISGTALDGTYRLTLSIPQYSEIGRWSASFYLVDAVGNSASLSASALAEANLPAGVDQVGGPGDSAAPAVAGFIVSPSTVDASTGAQIVTVTAHLTDDLSGLASYGPWLAFRSPSGRQTQSLSLSQQTGTARDGVWMGTVTVPRYAEDGAWTVQNFFLSDALGNGVALSAGDLTAAGFDGSFTQTGAADTTAPTLAGLTVTPASVDTSAASAPVTVSAHITDDLGGLGTNMFGTLSVSFRSPSGHQTVWGSTVTRSSGNATDGVWQQSVTVPRDAEQGRWTLNPVTITDSLGNSRTYQVDELAAAGLPTSFVQAGAGDAAPRAVGSLSFTPATIDTSVAGTTVTVSARLTDDRSGVSGASLYLTSPSGRSRLYTSLNRTTGDGRDGGYEGRVTLPRYAETGTWRVDTLSLYDLTQNSVVLTAADLRAAGLSSSFSQTGSGDTTAPDLAGLSWSPAAVDTTAASQTVTVRASLTDDLSGLPTGYGPYVVVQSPSGRQSVSLGLSRVSGTARNAVFEAAATVPRFSEAGAWTVKELTITDNVGNTRRLTAADITAAGMAAGFTQTGTGDTTPPVLASVAVTPARIDTSTAPASVTLTARLRDGGSGVAPYSGVATFTGPSGAKTTTYLSTLASGTAADGTYQASLSVPRYAAPGPWTLTGFEVRDRAGNIATLTAADLAAAGLSASFEQTGRGGDRQAPVLADFSVTPTAVNVATSSQRVTLRANVTDDLSGAASYGMTVAVTSPSGQPVQSVALSEYTRTSGTGRDGTYEASFVLPYRSEAGPWSLEATLWDNAGNSVELDGAALARLGFPGAIDVQNQIAPSAPAAPWGVTASSGNAAATVGWNATADDGGSPVTGYTVTARAGGAAVKTVTVDAAVTTAEIGGLHNGTPYTFTVTATNAIGTGPESVASNATTPATVPGAPDGVWAAPDAGSATVHWSAPADDGGNPIATYRIAVRSGGATVKTVDVAAPATTAVVTGLANGTAYTFTVTADNAIGASAESGASAAVTPITWPAAPSGLTATAGNASAGVSWTTPADNGGSPVISYTVSILAPGAVTTAVTVDAPATSVTVDGLTNGTAYRFAVSATNAAGTGQSSAPTSAVTPVTTPGAPGNVTATAGDGSVVVRWAAPAANGGSAVTGYTVTAADAGSGATVKTVSAGKSATSVTVGGLHNGTTYRFTVAASNAVGTGAASNPSADVTPAATTTTTTVAPPTTTTTAPPTTTTTAPATTTTTTASPPNPSVTKTGVRSGYWMVSAEGRVYGFGDATSYGDPRGQLGQAEAVDLEPTASGNGYWVLDDAGHVFPYGDARRLGNVDRTKLAAGERATSLSRTPSGAGYWVFTSRGRVLTFGDAAFHGDMSNVTLNGPVLDSIATPSGHGYYMVASDGGIFAFGDATFHGSMGGKELNAPVQSLVPDGDGDGYWLVASDGGIFAFDAPFRGSMGSSRLNRPVTGMVPFGNGYLMVGEDGGIFAFSDRDFLGSLGANPPARPVVAVAVLETLERALA